MSERFLRIAAVAERTGMSRSWLYREIKRGAFPRPLKTVGKNVSIWPESSIAEWQRARLDEHEAQTGSKAA